MKIRDLLNQEIDIDVYDDIDESLGIAFCGPMYLTDAGKEKFKDILDIEVEMSEDSCLLLISDEPDEERKLDLATDFFHGLAGYCTPEEYEAWFSDSPITTELTQKDFIFTDEIMYHPIGKLQAKNGEYISGELRTTDKLIDSIPENIKEELKEESESINYTFFPIYFIDKEGEENVTMELFVTFTDNYNIGPYEYNYELSETEEEELLYAMEDYVRKETPFEDLKDFLENKGVEKESEEEYVRLTKEQVKYLTKIIKEARETLTSEEKETANHILDILNKGDVDLDEKLPPIDKGSAFSDISVNGKPFDNINDAFKALVDLAMEEKDYE